MRERLIFGLTHFYPVFIAAHLYFGDWCRICQVMFNVVPLMVFAGLFYVWKETSHLRLTKRERFCIKFLIWNMIFIYSYYTICVFSVPKWVWDKNWQVAAFITITLFFYTFNYRVSK